MDRRWVQVVGIFDSEQKTGEIIGVQPARMESEPPKPEESELSLAVLDQNEQVLSEIAVEPEFGSCGDDLHKGTFQVFLEAPEAARVISLRLQGVEISRLVPGVADTAAPAAERFGFGPRVNHTVPLVQSAPADPNATYTLQAREKGAGVWQTMDIGLDRPDGASVDLNQFPGAKAIEVRMLKSMGFDTVEIDRADIDFDH